MQYHTNEKRKNKHAGVRMKSSSELDALIAEHVMGLILEKDLTIPPKPTGMYLISRTPVSIAEIPCYSTDIAAAWKVVEKITTENTGFMYDCLWRDPNTKKWQFGSFGRDGEFFGEESSLSAPLAICMAALKAKGIDIPPKITQK